MDIFDGENFEQLVNHRFFDVTDHGPLYYPLYKFKIYRDEKQQLILETEAAIDSKTDRQDSLPGTVRTNNSTAEFLVLDHRRVLFKGVQHQSSQDHFDTLSVEGNYRKERSRVWELEVTLADEQNGTYLVEWLDNLDDGRYIFPDLITDNIQTKLDKSFQTDTSKFEVSISVGNKGMSRNCIQSVIDGISYYLVITKRHEKGSRAKGYILYTSIPTKKTRDKLRGSLSFVLGRPLVYLGHTIFDKKWSILSTYAKSAHTYEGRAYDLHSLPPLPLSLISENEIDPNIFTQSVTSIYRNYENLKLETLLWNYWYAMIASLAIAPAHWGALLESLIKIASSQAQLKFKNTIFDDREKWNNSKLPLLEAVDFMDLEPVLKQILINKINNLNQLPQSEINKNFLSKIGLELNVFEMGVWRNRNKAAHGVAPKPDDYHNLIREIKVLKVLWHRIILSVTGASDYYIDYYTINFPIRPLNHSIPLSGDI